MIGSLVRVLGIAALSVMLAGASAAQDMRAWGPFPGWTAVVADGVMTVRRVGAEPLRLRVVQDQVVSDGFRIIIGADFARDLRAVLSVRQTGCQDAKTFEDRPFAARLEVAEAAMMGCAVRRATPRS